MKNIALTLSFLFFFFTAFAWNTPGMDSPSYGASTYTGLYIDWFAVSSSQQYQMQLDTSADFNSPLFYSVTKNYINTSSNNSDTEQYVDNLLFGEQYYWRVRAWVPGDTSSWSTPGYYTTRDYISLDYPSSGSTTYTGVTLDWYAHTGVDYYEMEADTSIIFDSPVKRHHLKAYVNSSSSNSDTEQYLDNLFFGETYYWRVRAINANDTSGWSSVWHINTRDYVSLDYPSSGSTTYSGVTLDWYAHTGVDYYEMEADTSLLFNSIAKRHHIKAYVNSSSSNSDTEQYLDNLFFGTTYYWRVRVINTVDTSAWSPVWSINTRDYVSLDYPSSGSTTYTGVTLDWYAHTGVDYYEMEADTSLNFDSPVKRHHVKAYINSSSSNSDTEQYLDNLYFGATYYWRVRTINAADTSGWSSIWNFNTRDYVSLYSPSNGSTAWAGLELDWYSHYGVDYYDMEADTSLQFNSPAKRANSKAYINSSSSNSDTEQWLEDLYFGATYYWRVRARNAVDTSAWSEIRNYTTRNYVNLSYPSDGALNVSSGGVTLDWYSHTGINIYQLQFDTTNLFNSVHLVQSNKNYINNSSSNNDTRHSTGALLPNTIYVWRVRVVNLVDTSAWTTRSFSTGSNPIVFPDIPELIAPENFAVDQSLNPILNWSDALAAESYFIEYDVSPGFSSPISLSADLSEIQIFNLSLSETYFWRVRSFKSGLVSDWSMVWQFSTGLDSPDIITPENDSINAPIYNLQLDWTDVANADWYELEYSPDETFVLGVTSENVLGSDTILNNLLYSTPYFWRVRAVQNNSPGEWSEVWNFTTQQNLNQVYFDLKVFLQGPYFFGQMIPFLNFYNLIPNDQPYDAEPWNYAGPEFVAAMPNPNVVDWVLVEIRETSGGVLTANNETVVGRRAGFILNNGSIVDIDGSSLLTFDLSVTDDLYAVIWHRNHLGVMSNYPLNFNNGSYEYDFSSGIDQVYGEAIGNVEVGGGVWAMTAGDADSDGEITNNDKVDFWEEQLSQQGYLKADFNINAFCDYPDKDTYWELNVGKACQVIRGSEEK
jgi:hypothetical protein